MKLIKLSDYFSEFCSNGEKSNEFLINIVIPELEKNEKVCFDFQGIRNMNSSFSNALFSNLIRKLDREIIKRITFSNCEENIKLLISTSLSMGLKDLDLRNKS
jgi:hypothetical protein